MFNLPGLSSRGTAAEDVADLRRYLTMLIPQLEQELMNLSADNFASDYNEIMEGLQSAETIRDGGKADSRTTTSRALAAHLQNTDNPHKVTRAQLGIEEQTAESLGVLPLHGMSGYNLICHETNEQAVASGGAIFDIDLGGMQDGDRLEGWMKVFIGTGTTLYSVNVWLDGDETAKNYYGKRMRDGTVNGMAGNSVARATSHGCFIRLRLEKMGGALMLDTQYISAKAATGTADNSEVGYAQWVKKNAAGSRLTVKAGAATVAGVTQEIALWRV